jgi:S-adenosylmethionine:tRNA ribosyltransferase-isomerase
MRGEQVGGVGAEAGETPDAMSGLRLSDLDYELPPELIAQHPADPRDSSRLLVVRRRDGRLEDRLFSDLPALFEPGDLLVRNDTKVFPARAFFRRATGGRIETLFLERAGEDGTVWEALVRGRPGAGEELTSEAVGGAWRVRCEQTLGDGRWLLRSLSRRPVLDLLAEAGVTPLPPYIHETLNDPGRYQTTYAKVTGSAAAPTAGLHFTPAVDAALAAAGVGTAAVTLHVGLGTFKPLQNERLADNRLHAEPYEVPATVWRRAVTARAEGHRVVAVGTTSMRVLEHLAQSQGEPPLAGQTSLFIAPGFAFGLVGGLLTNFHLPRTSLLALVMAFAGVETTREAYRHAVAAGYRFYSFGDAMLVL